MLLLLTILLVGVTAGISHAQTHIEGTVWDSADGMPVPRATIRVGDTNTGTAANGQELEEVKAYDADGNVHWLDAEGPPEDRPVVVIGINERLNEKQVKALGKANSKFGIGGIIGGVGDVIFGNGDSNADATEYHDDDRETYDHEYLDRVKVTDDKEPWWHGDPEIKIAAFSDDEDGIDASPLYQGGLSKREGADMWPWATGGRTTDDKTWNGYDRRIFGWDPGQDYALYYLYEHDDGADLGRNTIVYAGKEYGIGSLEITEDRDVYGKVQVKKWEHDDITRNLGGIRFDLESKDR